MSHFRAGCEAVVVYSYSDVHGTPWPEQEAKYALMLDLKTGPSFSAWYPESILALTGTDRDAGEAVLQEAKSK